MVQSMMDGTMGLGAGEATVGRGVWPPVTDR